MSCWSRATVAIAWRAEAAAAALPAAALLAVLVIARWALDLNLEHLVAPSGPVAGAVPEPAKADVGWHLTLGFMFAALFGVTGFLAQGRSERAARANPVERGAVFTPLAILAALYYRVAKFEPSIPFAGVALAARRVVCHRGRDCSASGAPRPGLAAAGAMFATGAVAALALALTMALEKGWLTVALALMVPGIAWVAQSGRCRRCAGWPPLIGVLVLARIGWEPRIVGATSAPRRSSIGCCTAMACRPPRSGSPAICCDAAPTMFPRA